jgi:hypothetical protein
MMDSWGSKMISAIEVYISIMIAPFYEQYSMFDVLYVSFMLYTTPMPVWLCFHRLLLRWLQ